MWNVSDQLSVDGRTVQNLLKSGGNGRTGETFYMVTDRGTLSEG